MLAEDLIKHDDLEKASQTYYKLPLKISQRVFLVSSKLNVDLIVCMYTKCENRVILKVAMVLFAIDQIGGFILWKQNQ